MRKLWSFIALIVLLFPILTACGGGEEATATSPPAAEPTEEMVKEPTQEAVEEFVCEDELGCVTVNAGEKLRIATALVISGPNETLGIDAQRGVEIAIDDRQNVLGFEIELVAEDGQCNAEGGQTAATKITSDETIVAVVGHNCSSSCTPAAPIYDQAGFTMISPSCTAPALTGEGTHVPSFLRTCHNDKVQGSAAARFFYEELEIRSAATIHDGSPYAEQLQQVFADTFAELGGTITAQEAVNVGDTDMRPLLTSIAVDQPELLYYPIFVAEGGFITVQAKEIAGLEDTILAGADGMISPDFVEAAGDAGEGMYITGPNLDFSANPLGQAFSEKHQAKYGEDPISAFHAHAWDAAMMIFDGIEQVGVLDKDGNLHIGRKALRDAIYGTANFSGVTGTLTCNEFGDCADPSITVNKIQGGEYVGIWNDKTGYVGEAPVVEESALPTFDDTFRVAVIMPSAINDLAFSQSMYDALVAIQEEMGGPDKMELVYSDGMFVVDDAAAAIRDYASQGFDLVIAHGSQYGSSLQEIAPDFPETSFAHGTTVNTFVDEGINNVFAYEAASDQGGYVNGVMAGKLTQSNVVGVVGPIETGDAKLYVDGFVAGVKAANPDAEVNVNYIGSFSDVALASEAANTHIAAGADVLAGTAQMVVGAIGVAEENGALWFGTQASQTSLAPDIVVANQVYDWTVVLREIITLIAEGTRGGQAYSITLENGGLLMEYNSDFDLPADVKTLSDETAQGIVDGSITIELGE